MSHDYDVFLSVEDAPDPIEQAYPFDPTVADRQAVDAERARERQVRADQGERIAVELARIRMGEAAAVARSVAVEPGW